MQNRVTISRRTLLATTVIGFAAPALAAQTFTYRNAKAPIAMRVRDLLSRMTLEEKAAQLCSMWETKRDYQDDDGNLSEYKAAAVLAHGIGQIARPSDYRGFPRWDDHPFRSIRNTVEQVNAVQKFLIEKTRLGIPALFHEELAHGYLAGEATIFPTPTALASTWDPELVEKVFTVASREARVRGATVALAPVLDLIRDPRYGRSEEFFGEDPYLVAEIGTAAVRGIQGRARPLAKDRVYTTLKHFVHGVPLGGLNTSPADISERSLRENFLVPFEKVIKQTDPAIVMPSYNELQGVPDHANGDLLQNTGRRRLGFKGAYFSDYDGIQNLRDVHHIAKDLDDAAALAIKAGVQADLPEGHCFRRLPDLVRSKRVDESLVDAAVAKVLALKFEAGLFETPYLDPAVAERETGTDASRQLAREAAEKSLILLTNDGTVPIEPKANLKIALIGPNSVEPLLGGYSGGNESSVGIYKGLQNAAPAGVSIEQSDGVWITPPDKLGLHRSFSPVTAVPPEDNARRIAQAVEVAKRSDIVVLVVGDVPAITRETVAFEVPGDRETLDLWGQQNELFEALLAAGKPIVTLLINGRPLTVNRVAEKSNALFEGWYLGQEGGNAFANILFGHTNPGGKLSVSIPRSVGQLPVYYNMHPSAVTLQYVEGTRKPLFPFGHGLSYTTFDISEPKLRNSTIRTGETAWIDVEVRNTGTRKGDEVVQLYIRDDISSVPRPVLELKAFQRVTLAPGESKTISFALDKDALAFWNIDMKWVVEPGTFTISVGGGSDKLKASTLTVTGAVA